MTDTKLFDSDKYERPNEVEAPWLTKGLWETKTLIATNEIHFTRKGLQVGVQDKVLAAAPDTVYAVLDHLWANEAAGMWAVKARYDKHLNTLLLLGKKLA